VLHLSSIADMGVVKALIENDAMPPIVSGTSGGAIVTAMLAVYTDEEMLDKVIQPDIATRYPERWFPPMEQQLYSYLKSGCLVEHNQFANCCKAYFGDSTFAEAYARTGRVANINISVGSRQGGVGKRGSLLLNHLTAPQVLIRSALHASCALPTVMHPTTLLMKTSSGEILPFERESLEFIDGSFTADIPRSRLSELFHVTQNVVSQVNPHVVAMIHSRKGARYSMLHNLQQYISADVLHRLRSLAKLRLLPAMYGPDLTAAMQQRYTGDVTVVPRIGGPYAIIKMVQNPDRQAMLGYISEGQRAAFPRLSHIKHLMAVERALERGLRALTALRTARSLAARKAQLWEAAKNGSLGRAMGRGDVAGDANDRPLLMRTPMARPRLFRSLSFPSAAGNSPEMGDGAEAKDGRLTPGASPAAAERDQSNGAGGGGRADAQPPAPVPAPVPVPVPVAADAQPPAGGSGSGGTSSTGRRPMHKRSLSYDPCLEQKVNAHQTTPQEPSASSTLETEALTGPLPLEEVSNSSPWLSPLSGTPTTPASAKAAHSRDDDARSKMLLSQSVKHTKALQQLTREKAGLQKTVDEQAEMLRASQAACDHAETRMRELEGVLEGVQRAALAGLTLSSGGGSRGAAPT
jgi:predicted acylesterase/phospholipase RssA